MKRETVLSLISAALFVCATLFLLLLLSTDNVFYEVIGLIMLVFYVVALILSIISIGIKRGVFQVILLVVNIFVCALLTYWLMWVIAFAKTW